MARLEVSNRTIQFKKKVLNLRTVTAIEKIHARSPRPFAIGSIAASVLICLVRAPVPDRPRRENPRVPRRARVRRLLRVCRREKQRAERLLAAASGNGVRPQQRSGEPRRAVDHPGGRGHHGRLGIRCQRPQHHHHRRLDTGDGFGDSALEHPERWPEQLTHAPS
jgi:hypothetical protein